MSSRFRVSPLIRRLLARNPSPFTFKGTGVAIIGKGEVAVIDPGPDDPEHLAALRAALEGETVTHIFVTHTHRDHSPAAQGAQGVDGRADLWLRPAWRRQKANTGSRWRRAAIGISSPT